VDGRLQATVKFAGILDQENIVSFAPGFGIYASR